MFLLVVYVGELMGYICRVFPLVELCLLPDFRVEVVENADFPEFAFCRIYEAACRFVGEVVFMVF